VVSIEGLNPSLRIANDVRISLWSEEAARKFPLATLDVLRYCFDPLKLRPSKAEDRGSVKTVLRATIAALGALVEDQGWEETQRKRDADNDLAKVLSSLRKKKRPSAFSDDHVQFPPLVERYLNYYYRTI